MIYIHVPFCRSFCIYCGFYSELCPNAAARPAIVSSGVSSEEIFCEKSPRSNGSGIETYVEAASRPSPGTLPSRSQEPGIEASSEVVSRETSSTPRSCGADIEAYAEGASCLSPGTLPSRSQEPGIEAYVEAVLAEIDARKDEIRAHAACWQQGNFDMPVCGLRPGESSGTCSETFSGTSSKSCSGADFRTRFVTRYGTGTASPDTVYFGGGTPSLLPVDDVRRIMTALRALGVTGADECTFEVNPDDIVRGGVEYVKALLEAGVNRVSMGVQSLDDGILHWMGRRHDAACARAAFGILRAAGVRNISVDLIFGLPQLSEKQLLSTIDGVLSLGPEHISAYQLSVEEDSTLAQMLADGRFVEASDEQCRRQYDLICGRLREAGYNHYEISNWARPGAEAVHNSAYWRRVPYIGLGPGAHSFSISAASFSAGAASPDVSADSPNVLAPSFSITDDSSTVSAPSSISSSPGARSFSITAASFNVGAASPGVSADSPNVLAPSFSIADDSSTVSAPSSISSSPGAHSFSITAASFSAGAASFNVGAASPGVSADSPNVLAPSFSITDDSSTVSAPSSISSSPGAHSFSVGAASSVPAVPSDAFPGSGAIASGPSAIASGPSAIAPGPSAIALGHSDSSIVPGSGVSSFVPGPDASSIPSGHGDSSIVPGSGVSSFVPGPDASSIPSGHGDSSIFSDVGASSFVPGPGASSIASGHSESSFVPGHCLEKRSWNTQSVVGYTAESEVLTYKEAVEESIMLALRTSFGIEERVLRGFLKRRRNIPPEGLEDGSQDVIGELLFEGALIRDCGRIRIPEDHFFVSDDIILRLVEGLEP